LLRIVQPKPQSAMYSMVLLWELAKPDGSRGSILSGVLAMNWTGRTPANSPANYIDRS
jgi:hypothetical protein